MTDAALKYLVEVQDRDLRELKKTVAETNKALGTGVEQATAKGSKGFQGFGRNAKVIAGGALVALGAAAKIGFDELAEGQKVSAQTGAVLKSTGGVANVTAKDVDGLARSLSEMSGVDDEAIASGENLLLTFTKVRNEVGQGNAVFDRATQASLDLSVAMGKDMQSSALLVGKALNDPIKGSTALTRAGIQLTDAQKEQIKSFTEAGDVASAQKIILGELETQFGGSAEAAGKTLPGQLARAKVSFENLTGDLLQATLPALNAFASIMQDLTGFLTEHQTAAKIAIGVIAALAIGVFAVNAALKVYSAMTTVATAVQWLFNHAVKAHPFFAIIGAILLFVGAIVLAWKKSERFREIVLGSWSAIKAGAARVWGAVKAIVRGALNALIFYVKNFTLPGLIFQHWRRIRDVTLAAWNAVRDFVTGNLGAARDRARSIVGGIRDFLRDTWGTIKRTGKTAWEGIKAAIEVPLRGIRTLVNLVGDGLDRVKSVFTWITNNAKRIADKLGDLLGPLEKVGGLLGKIPGVGDVASGFHSAIAAARRGSYAARGGGVGSGGLSARALAVLDFIRRTFGDVVLSSGFRTIAQNRAAGGASNSDHLTGRAIDLVPPGGWSAAGTRLLDSIAAWAAAQPFVRWIGWRGVPGHGPNDHLHLSFFDRGGIVTGPTLGYLGERRSSSPEAVLPLGSSRGRGFLEEALTNALASALERMPSAGGPIMNVENLIVRDELHARTLGASLSRAVLARP